MELFEGVKNILNNNFVFLTMFLFLSVASYIDCKTHKIYNKFNLLFMIARIVLSFIPVVAFPLNINSILGAIVGGLLLLIPAVILFQNFAGDIKIIFVIGLYLEVKGILLFLAISYLIYVLYTGMLCIKHYKSIKKNNENKINDNLSAKDKANLFVLNLANKLESLNEMNNDELENDLQGGFSLKKRIPFAPFLLSTLIILKVII